MCVNMHQGAAMEEGVLLFSVGGGKQGVFAAESGDLVCAAVLHNVQVVRFHSWHRVS